MKRFIIISLATILTVPALACFWVDNHNYYLFSVHEREGFHERANKITQENWKVYLGQENKDYFYFDAEEITKIAQQKGDVLMASYVQQLQSYLECVRSKEREQYSWNYPTAEEVAERNKLLGNIRLYAQGKLTSRLRSQHALLFMRCNMMLGRHSENVKFWEETASKFINTIYRDMMRNIYAGALLKTGQGNKAAQIFAEQGDWNSLMTQYYEKRSFQAISQEYRRDPNSAVLPFLLQDFVNNAQEAVDGNSDGKLFIRKIIREEAQQMINFAGQVAGDGKCGQPALWMMAKAWLEFLYVNKKQALTDINTALSLDGTERVKDNARVIKLYITAMQTKPDTNFDNYLCGELQWLNTKKEEDGFYWNALDRITHQALAPQYATAHRQTVSLALLSAIHATLYTEYIDTMAVENLLEYIDYAQTTPHTPLDKYLVSAIKIDKNELNDLVGMKYMRTCQWENAQKWFKKIPLSYYDNKGFVIYANRRSYKIAPWIQRQWVNESEELDDNTSRHLSENPRMVFAAEMQKMEKDLLKRSGEDRRQLCYELAVRYAQADQRGDCWFLLHNMKSYYTLSGANDVDIQGKAVSLLRQASESKDLKLREKALFGLAYIYLNETPWYETKWNANSRSFYREVNALTQHYKAWKTFADFEKSNPGEVSDYVSRCDEYKQFLKAYQP